MNALSRCLHLSLLRRQACVRGSAIGMVFHILVSLRELVHHRRVVDRAFSAEAALDQMFARAAKRRGQR